MLALSALCSQMYAQLAAGSASDTIEGGDGSATAAVAGTHVDGGDGDAAGRDNGTDGPTAAGPLNTHYPTPTGGGGRPASKDHHLT